MDYKSTDINELNESLRDGVVTFEYKKKDGTVRTAKGTMKEEYLPERIPERIKFECEVIDALMKAKNIETLDDYARENGLVYKGIIEIEGEPASYLFTPIKKKTTPNPNLMSYYDVEKDAFRSFIKENFLGIVE